MGYIKSRLDGRILGTYCDVCGKEYVKVIHNPIDKDEDICFVCYNEFFNNPNKIIIELQKEVTCLQEKQDLLIKFIYELFYNHNELLNEDDLGRLKDIINYKGDEK